MTEQVPSDTSDTPKTDAVVMSLIPEIDGKMIADGRLKLGPFVPADFARAQERRIVELETAVRNFVKGMDEAEQIRELVTKISGNPVNGVSAYIWWCSRYLNVSCFVEAQKALQS